MAKLHPSLRGARLCLFKEQLAELTHHSYFTEQSQVVEVDYIERSFEMEISNLSLELPPRQWEARAMDCLLVLSQASFRGRRPLSNVDRKLAI